MKPRVGSTLSALLTLALSGCVAPPRSSLPAVQQQVKARSGLNIAWPQSVAEKSAADRAVSELLQQEFTPDNAVAIALLNNRSLRATFEEVGISEAELMAAGRLPNPSFSASVRWPDTRARGPNVEFNLGIDLLNALLLPTRKKLSGEQLVRAEDRVAHEVLALAAEVKSAVYTVQARQFLRARLASIVEVNAAATDLAQRQYDAGNINHLEWLNQQVAEQETRLELSRADAQILADREKLNRLLGLADDQINWKSTSSLPPIPERESSFDDIEAIALKQRLDLAAAQSQVTLSRAALDLKRKTRFLPASVDVGIDTERDPGGSSRVTGPNISLRLPVFDQGQPEMARLSSDWRRAEDNFEALATTIRSEVREARDALLAARATVEYYDHVLVPQRRAILRETLLHYNAMQKSNYELLGAKEKQLAVERECIEALRDYWRARADLEFAVGGKLPGEAAPAPAMPASANAAVPEHEPLSHP